ncbi:hypothetical protein DSL72_004498 [Monilinia vaccinii-corymbosi]|uniref:Uncharacterized protein n=1 Tax=Monilinia vaccinii-corymbosi TaxID=61207 RepID=A0A8A3P0N7_9HELO|nr:hypothetical protein DSL72_004498 [Monilinia vaccinii-corymbosi]
MCKYTFHQSATCHRYHHGHKYKDKDTPQPCQWIQIAQPCAWGAGLLRCPMFASNALRIGGPNVIRVKRRGCPRHDFGGAYDRNLVRMVEEVRTGGSWFGPPDIMPEPREVKKKKKKKQKKNKTKKLESGDVKLCVVM